MVECFTKATGRRCAVILGCVLVAGAPARAQVVPDPDPLPAPDAGHVARSASGEVGARQTRSSAAASVEPMVRIDGRIANRVQNRFRNRIDRNYDPQENATSPFRTATDRTRAAVGEPQP